LSSASLRTERARAEKGDSSPLKRFEMTEVWRMKAEKIRNLTDEELSHQEREMNDQLFKLKFQLNMGQTESLKKIRGLRKDIARVKTIVRERAASGEKK
jgi:large subunit ribosomal protein L29